MYEEKTKKESEAAGICSHSNTNSLDIGEVSLKHFPLEEPERELILRKTTIEEAENQNCVSVRKRKQSKPTQLYFNSNAKVYRKETHGFGIWNNERVPFTTRIDSGIKKASKPILKQLFGSTCRGVETILAGLIATYEAQGVSGVYRGTTVEIGKLIIKRNIKTRRKLVVDEEITEKVSVEKCSFCGKPKISEFRHRKSGIIKNACEDHSRILLNRSDWQPCFKPNLDLSCAPNIALALQNEMEKERRD